VAVDAALVGQTVAAGLRKLLPDHSWSAVRKLIEQRRVLVNQYPCFDEARRLADNDEIEVALNPAPLPPDENQVELVYVDDAIVVAFKPAGMVTERRHDDLPNSPELRWQELTLDEAVTIKLLGGRPYAADPRSQNQSRPAPRGNDRPFTSRDHAAHSSPARSYAAKKAPLRMKAPPCHVRAAHRLDRQTSGLVVLSRQPDVGKALLTLFKTHDIRREYEALAWGHVTPQRLVTELSRDRGDGLRGSRPPAEGDVPPALPTGTPERVKRPTANRRAAMQVAITNIVASQPGFVRVGEGEPLPASRVTCRLETGRTHQIRIHLSELGHAIAGDVIYGARSLPRLPRLFLHARLLGFRHPVTNRLVEFTSTWPEADGQWLETNFKSAMAPR
jgi:23S rRNA pseudouridine1911/1915/1917 synthase